MVKRIAIAAVVLFWCLSASAVQTLVTREMFDGIGTITNGAIGNLGTWVSGAWYKRAVGPTDTNSTIAQGFSADVRRAAFGAYYDLTSVTYTNASTNGCIAAWFRFTNCGTGVAPNNFSTMMQLRYSDDASLLRVGVMSPGWLTTSDTSGTVLTNVMLSLHTWYYITLEYRNQGSGIVSYRVSYTPLGGAKTTAKERLSYNAGSSRQFLRAAFVNAAVGTGGQWDGRIGACGLYSIDAIGDAGIPAGVTDPVETNRTWYVNPSTGSDTNTGLASTNAWLTASKLSTELFYNGVMGTLTPWKDNNGNVLGTMTGAQFKAQNDSGGLVPNGDTVVVDTSSTNLLIDTPIAIFNRCPGLHLTSANSSNATLNVFTPISSASWSLVSGLAKTYKSTNTEQYAILWEDRKWMNHTNGANFNAISNTIETTPGSFWTDGTQMYVHPFSSSNPTSDGKTYERSRLWGSAASNAIVATAVNIQLSKLSVGGTAIADSASADYPANTTHYGILIDAANNKVDSCYTEYTAKHGIGCTSAGTSQGLIVEDTQAEQGTLYTVNGGQSPFVCYTGTGTNVVAQFLRCTTLKTRGLIGSTVGQNYTGDPAFYTHGGGVFFDDVYVEDCYFPVGQIGQANNSIANGLTVTRTRLGLAALDKAQVTRCWFDYGGLVPNVSGTVTATNCVFVPTVAISSVEGTCRLLTNANLTVTSSTIDLRSSAATGTQAWLYRINPATVTFYDNIVINKSGEQFAPFSGFVNTDTLSISNNVYLLGSSSLVSLNYNDGGSTNNRTLSQWQALGFDANSLNANPCLSANYRPYSKTPCWNIGVELGPLSDYSGKIYQSRRTVGAYEYTTLKPDYILTGP